jgi:hypothetical protein
MSRQIMTPLFLIIFFTYAVACGRGSQGASGSEQKREVATEAIKFTSIDYDPLTAPAKVAAKVNYAISIIAKSGNEVCRGTTQINIMSNLELKFPTGTVKCLMLTLDLSRILGDSFLSANPGLGNFTSDGKVLYIKEIGKATFDPPRPFFLGPLVQNPDDYKDFKLTVPETVTVNDPEANVSLSGTGQFDVEVLSVGGKYSNELSPANKFNNVMRWAISSSGFDGVPTKYGLLYKKMEWYWNTQPLMIPKIVISGDLAAFIGSSSGGSGISRLVGDVTISLSVKDFEYGT